MELAALSVSSTSGDGKGELGMSRGFGRLLQGKGWGSEDTSELFEPLYIDDDRLNQSIRHTRTIPSAILAAGLRFAKLGGRIAGAAGLCAFAPNVSKLVVVAAVISHTQERSSRKSGRLPAPSSRTSPLPTRLLSAALLPFNLIKGPLLVFGAMWAIMPAVCPATWRSVLYWQRMMPIVWGYVKTGRRVKRMRAHGCSADEVDAVWAVQHEKGAAQMFQMLSDIQGFYMKLGQILATKTDMLPAAYTTSLRHLCDDLSPTPFPEVKEMIERELKGKLSSAFLSVEPVALASATIAQVHRAKTLSGDAVVVKLQHRCARRMMKADLVNMKVAVELMELFHINVGFDIASVVREYYVQVPMEFDFLREMKMAETVREALEDHAAELPLLRMVVIPKMYPSLTTPRLLTMAYFDGVPLLEAVEAEHSTKQLVMASLVLAYGVSILREGVFHTDPHPGNLMVNLGVRDKPKIAILDFGQVKELSEATRLRYAVLVAALAARDDNLVLVTMRELGMRVKNCTPEFEATAAYILFDTRMDFPEALQSPLDPAANEGWRTAKVPSLPQDLFMVVRVITLLRGLMASLQVDVSSAIMWRPFALATIADLTAIPRSLTPSSSTVHTPNRSPLMSPRASSMHSRATFDRSPSPQRYPPSSVAASGDRSMMSPRRQATADLVAAVKEQQEHRQQRLWQQAYDEATLRTNMQSPTSPRLTSFESGSRIPDLKSAHVGAAAAAAGGHYASPPPGAPLGAVHAQNGIEGGGAEGLSERERWSDAESWLSAQPAEFMRSPDGNRKRDSGANVRQRPWPQAMLEAQDGKLQ